MIQKKQFSFGGLNINMHVHPQFGCVTTPAEFAGIVGVDRRTVARLMVKHGLMSQKLAEEDKDFAKNLISANLPLPNSEINLAGANLPLPNRPRSNKATTLAKVFLTVKGMIFLTMLLRTERAMAFRMEVLETIEKVEAGGFSSMSELADEMRSMKQTLLEQGVTIAEIKDHNQHLLAVIFEQKEKIESLEEKLGYRAKADKLRRSADGKRLAAGKYEKKIEDMH